MKYAVVVTAITDGFDAKTMLDITKPSLEKYCSRTKSDLIIIDEPKLNIADNIEIKHHPYYGKYNYLRFEKNQVYDLFETYDKVLRLDVDIVINPYAPNYFELEDYFFYITEEEPDRSSEILNVQRDLGEVEGWNKTYFNSGVVLASKKHKEVFNMSDIDFNLELGMFKEQNVLNWKVRKLNIPTKDLGRSFNFINDGGPAFLNDDLRREANIIHHNIPIRQTKKGSLGKIDSMKKDINFFLSERRNNRKLI
tara:strand:+ start:2674 stop:3429 length:756 start_codon:yes stop_codon:yes gene_type:complete